MTGGLKTGDFDFDLPEGAIADRPAVPREAARLLEVGPSLHDRSVADLPELLRAGDVLVLNDTKVIPARIVGTRGRARVEATLLRPLDCTAEGETWSALARAGAAAAAGQHHRGVGDVPGAGARPRRRRRSPTSAFPRVPTCLPRWRSTARLLSPPT